MGFAALAVAATSYAFTADPIAGVVVGVLLVAAFATVYFMSIQQKVQTDCQQSQLRGDPNVFISSYVILFLLTYPCSVASLPIQILLKDPKKKYTVALIEREVRKTTAWVQIVTKAKENTQEAPKIENS